VGRQRKRRMADEAGCVHPAHPVRHPAICARSDPDSIRPNRGPIALTVPAAGCRPRGRGHGRAGNRVVPAALPRGQDAHARCGVVHGRVAVVGPRGEHVAAVDGRHCVDVRPVRPRRRVVVGIAAVVPGGQRELDPLGSRGRHRVVQRGITASGQAHVGHVAVAPVRGHVVDPCNHPDQCCRGGRAP
jgi:hypothetical protein